MAPLVGYDSSDDDEDVQQVESPAEKVETTQDHQDDQMTEPLQEADATQPEETHPSPPKPQPGPSTEAPSIGPSAPPDSDSALMGPSLPPAEETEAYPEPEGEAMDQTPDPDIPADPSQPPSSPYTTNRSLIHTLTMPTVANLDIPPSPPSGSPTSDAAQASLTAKFDNFLELKRKKGVHFNARIADSHSFKNPAQTDKLLGFVGLDAAGAEQYGTVLPRGLWDPAAFPGWAYRKELRRTQEKVQKERGRKEGEAVQFVPASS